jgi:SAM-dependent methyltransferase
MTRDAFPLFQSHLDLVQHYWERIIQKGDFVIDATCGNGKDTVRLAKLVVPKVGCLDIHKSRYPLIHSIDVQKDALESAQTYALSTLTTEQIQAIRWIQGSHAAFPEEIPPQSVKAIIYNLGYLPGGNKAITTQTESTLQSIEAALPLLKEGGIITLTSYPGHAEGALESKALLERLASLDPKRWNICHHRWINRTAAPELFLIQHQLRA